MTTGTHAVIAALVEALGAERVLVGSDVPARYHADWSELAGSPPAALVMPRRTAEVAAVLRICHAHAQPVVVQGGLTGLAGGATPRKGEIALSLERMSGVLVVDAASATLTAWAGTPLLVVQQAAEGAGFHCGVDLGARGSCTVGGNAATNAGGTQVLRYGMARQNILGLEAVLADGTVVSALNTMLKNNTGYDWKQLMIGSEGTLGIITQLVLALHPQPRGLRCAMLRVRDFDAALAVLRATESAFPGKLLSFEAMWPGFLRFVIDRCRLGAPFAVNDDMWLLVDIELPDSTGTDDALAEFLGELHEKSVLLDAVIAKSLDERARLWALREAPAEFPRLMPGLVGFDVSIPLGRMNAATRQLAQALAQCWPAATALFYGHVADSNLHLVVHVPELPKQPDLAIQDLVYGVVAAHGGAVSAEHGIGRVKRPYLPLSRSPEELALMHRIKTTLDPRGILNPGRIFM